MINHNSRNAEGPLSAPVTRLLDLLVSTAQNQRLALDLLQRHWKTAARPAVTARPQPEKKVRAETAPPAPPARGIPTAEVGAQVLRALQVLAAAGQLRVNEPSGPLYIDREHVALVIPDALRAVRSYLKTEGWTLPDRIYDALRDQGVAVADATGRIVKHLDVRVGDAWRSTDVRSILVPRARLDGLAAHAGFETVPFTEVPPAVIATALTKASAGESVTAAPTAEAPAKAASSPDLYGYEAGYDARRPF